MAVVWFEIPVLDLARAVEFYEAVLGVTLERRVIDGHEMAVFLEPEGAVGALAHGESYVPSLDGSRVYFAVPDVADTLGRAVAAGGQVLYPVTEVEPGVRVAEFADCEGNRIAISSGPDGVDAPVMA
ncbi:MAG: VOC family protein [Actinobacteria bacterium]|nr:VOC family protein [Actinomycetota bacterium]